MKDGAAMRIRLHGIGCLEKGQPFTHRAEQFTSSLAFGQEVTVKPRGQDRYGRTIGNVPVWNAQPGTARGLFELLCSPKWLGHANCWYS